MSKIIIAGGTGFIGKYLEKRFKETGYEVVIISRFSFEHSWNETELTDTLENADVLINLAGKSINCRHTNRNKQLLYKSRIDTTKMLGRAILSCKNPPGVWINASASGIYKPTFGDPHTENKAEFGNDFIAQLVKDWEKSFFDFNLNFTRKIALRTSVVLGKNGGALKPLILLSKLGLGGKQASGNQIFSWIHIEDYFQIILFLIKEITIDGFINCTSPHPVTNKTFMHEIRNACHRPFGFPAPKLAILAGAQLIGTEASLILNSSNILPEVLLLNGFKFKYPNIGEALRNICK